MQQIIRYQLLLIISLRALDWKNLAILVAFLLLCLELRHLFVGV